MPSSRMTTNDAQSEDETLYVVGDGLMKVDIANEKFVKVSDFIQPVDMELTGTGDGRLFGQERLMGYFIFLQPLHILYTVIAGWLGKFGRYEWKSRKVK